MENLFQNWGLPSPACSMKYSQKSSRYASTLEIRDTCPQSAQQNLLPRRQRSPSLPPIASMQEVVTENTYNMHISKHADARYSSVDLVEKTNKASRYEDGEGETSGYASDSAPHSSPEFRKNKQIANNKYATNNGRHNQSFPAWEYNECGGGERGRRSKLGQEEETRPKWGDKGVAVGRLWEPQDPESRLPQMLVKGTPSWVERGLNMIDSGGPNILVNDHIMSNRSSAGESMDPFVITENNTERCTYLLGQNVHIDPNIKAERECKRLKALELQAAIMQQLEEREKQKKDEKEKRLKEERDEEERFKRQLEVEKQRLLEERKIAEEKQQREQKRAEALRQALEKAELRAKLEKENKKFKKLRDNFDAMSITSEIVPSKECNNYSRKESMSPQLNPYNESKLIQNIYIEQAFSPRKKVLADHDNMSHIAPSVSSETNIIMSNPQSARYNRQIDNFNNEHNNELHKRHENQRHHPEPPSTAPQGNQPMNLLTEAPVSLVQIPAGHEVFTPVQFNHGNAVQMAFLLPQHINSIYPYIHQPVSMQNIYPSDGPFNQQHRHYQMQSQSHNGREECCMNRDNKLLTPSKYRNHNSRDVYTQTDFQIQKSQKEDDRLDEDDHVKNKSPSILEQDYQQNTSEEKLNSLTFKKDKKTEDKYKVEMESRPKWGVNKPPMQYKKQSEKDIFYPQKRKLRQRKRIQEKNYTSHSSDENRSPSPPRELSKSFPKLDRNRVSLTENYWRKKSLKDAKDMTMEHFTVETTQISPLECDQSGIVRIGENYSNKQKVYSETKTAAKKGITLSQKFMNDKYGNPKLWNNEIENDDKVNQKKDTKEDHNSRFREKSEQRKRFLDSVNRARKEQSLYCIEGQQNQPVILDQLRSLRDSLKKQQQLWGKYDPSDRSPSPKNDVDMEME